MDHRIRRVALVFALPFALAAVLGGSGCSSDNSVKPPTELAPPTAVATANGDGLVTISWTASPDESRSDFTGYNVYRWTSSLADTASGRLDHYKIGTASKNVSSFVDDFSSSLSNGENGVRYYYHVRSKRDDGAISVASTEVLGVGRPEGTGAVIEEFAGHLASGFNFASGDSISLSIHNPDRFNLTDMYLGTSDPHNDSASPLALKSPSTLDYAEPEWAPILTNIIDLGTDWTVKTGDEPVDDTSPVTLNHVYAFKMTSGNYAKIKVTAIGEIAGMRIIEFRYAYQMISGLYLF